MLNKYLVDKKINEFMSQALQHYFSCHCLRGNHENEKKKKKEAPCF